VHWQRKSERRLQAHAEMRPLPALMRRLRSRTRFNIGAAAALRAAQAAAQLQQGVEPRLPPRGNMQMGAEAPPQRGGDAAGAAAPRAFVVLVAARPRVESGEASATRSRWCA
jgi:hypothetical protein